MIKGPGFFTIDIIMKNKVYGLKEHIKKDQYRFQNIKIKLFCLKSKGIHKK